MILIADGGSTKCDWILLDKDGSFVLKTRTLGLNPDVLTEDIMIQRLEDNDDFKQCGGDVTGVYFYGAGCGTDKSSSVVQNVFKGFFLNATEILVKEDTYAAAFATATEPGIICILGTGSNSSFFDGDEVHTTIPSLGYMLMDEASGNYYGKQLIRDYCYHKMPEDLRARFSEMFDLDTDVLKDNIYKKENPNVYLAKLAEFIFRSERNDYFNSVIENGLEDFFQSRIITCDNHQDVPVHFVGSIAHFSSDIIHKIGEKYNVEIGNIVRRPIDGLIEYHRRKLQKVD